VNASGGHPRQGLLALHLAVLLVSFAGLFGKWIGVGALEMVVGRLLFAVPALALVIRWRGNSFRPPPSGERWLLLLSGGLLAAHWVSFFHSVQISTVAIALLGYASAPVFAVILEPLGYGEPFSRKSLAASTLIVAGMALIVPEWRWSEALFRGMVWGLVSGFTFALLNLLNRRLVRHAPSLTLALYLDAMALAALLPFLPRVWTPPSWADWGLMAIQGVVFTAVSHTLFIRALNTVQAQTVALVSTLEPLYGILLAAWLLGEIPPMRTVAGGVLILAAVLWVTARPLAPSRNGAAGRPGARERARR
jgi:drug/metabolite transporter (DMT)-like permease